MDKKIQDLIRVLIRSKKITENGCWENWRRSNNHGYCIIPYNGKHYTVHRISAAYFLGLDYEDKTQLALHKNSCNNKRCWNPKHLYVGNHSDNIRDSIELGNPHLANYKVCKRGHNAWGKRATGRYCLECHRLAQEKYTKGR